MAAISHWIRGRSNRSDIEDSSWVAAGKQDRDERSDAERDKGQATRTPRSRKAAVRQHSHRQQVHERCGSPQGPWQLPPCPVIRAVTQCLRRPLHLVAISLRLAGVTPEDFFEGGVSRRSAVTHGDAGPSELMARPPTECPARHRSGGGTRHWAHKSAARLTSTATR